MSLTHTLIKVQINKQQDKILMKKYLFVQLLFVSWLCTLSIVQSKILYPTPKNVFIETTHILQESNECISLQLEPHKLQDQENIGYYFNKIKTRELEESQCSSESESNHFQYPIQIQYQNSLKDKEAYKIITTPDFCHIQVRTYQGFVYAMETLSQMINEGQILIGLIEDEPQVSYRGIMIDSVRHFIGYDYIARLIESMPLAKLNMLHWHLSDDEAFVMQLVNHPELAKSGAYDRKSYYSIQQIKQLISLAEKNGVSIIPEFDTPAHTRSWGLDSSWKAQNITIECQGGEHYNHQFDLSKPKVYDLAKQVLSEVDNLFIKSPFIHLGGDETSAACWDQRPGIKTFMKLKNIKNYDELQMYWRYELKQALSESRKVVFWRTKSENITTGPEDVLQYWGAQNQTAQVVSKSESKVILSPIDYLYINVGQSFIWQDKPFGKYITWRQIYENFTVFPQGVPKQRILGAETCLWGQVSNQDTLENNLWPRVAAFGFKAWSSEIMSLPELVTALIDLQKQLKAKGIQYSPFVPQFCELNPETCFPSTASYLQL